MAKDNEMTLLGVKTLAGIALTLLTYKIVKDAVAGNGAAILISLSVIATLHQIGARERMAANLLQQAKNKAIGAGFIDTLTHVANNVTAGALEVMSEGNKHLNTLMR